MKSLGGFACLCLFLSSSWSLPSNRDGKDLRSPIGSTGDRIYGTEPYQLELQERRHLHAQNNYYPTSAPSIPNRRAYETEHLSSSAHSFHHRSNQRLRQKIHDPVDYDPFYFPIRNSVSPGSIRSRRNSKLGDLFEDDLLSNHLFNEDVHFFRRSDTPIGGNLGRRESISPDDSIRYKDSQRLPLYGSPKPYFPSSRLRFPPRQSHDPYNAPSSFHLTTLDRRAQYPLPSNQLPYHDDPRRHSAHLIPKLFVPELERYARAPVEGLSVQVGTQLHVHDDGRERNPNRFYVRDENPQSVRRYPHRHDFRRP